MQKAYMSRAGSAAVPQLHLLMSTVEDTWVLILRTDGLRVGGLELVGRSSFLG